MGFSSSALALQRSGVSLRAMEEDLVFRWEMVLGATWCPAGAVFDLSLGVHRGQLAARFLPGTFSSLSPLVARTFTGLTFLAGFPGVSTGLDFVTFVADMFI